jgi:flagellar basal-body rod modification protein FlgD
MVAAISSLSSATTDASASGKTTAKEQTDRFMKLLVAQLNNQDPMNPMDNAQMTSQIAQINTVSGIQEVNESIKSMATQFASMQMMQGASMIGHEVLTDSNKLTVAGGVGKGAVELAGNADKVSIQVVSPGGQVLDTLNLGAMTGGRHNFEWDASAYAGTGNPTFKVTATSGSTPVSTTTMARSTVESISSDALGMNLTLKGGSVVAYNTIKAIL